MQIPNSSQMAIQQADNEKITTIPLADNGSGIYKYLHAVLLILWLCAWAVMSLITVLRLFSGDANFFLLFWFCAWLSGAIWPALIVYKIFRKPAPEKITINKDKLSYETIIAKDSPFFSMNYFMRKDLVPLQNVSLKAKKFEFSTTELRTLKLRETQEGNRLTIDKDNTRIDLAVGATELEREWLSAYLQKFYSF